MSYGHGGILPGILLNLEDLIAVSFGGGGSWCMNNACWG